MSDKIFEQKLNQKQAAELLGVTAIWLGKLIKDYDFPRKPADGYDMRELVKAYVALIEARANKVNDNELAARVRLAESKAALMEIKLAEERGEVITVDDAIGEIESLLTATKTQMMALPKKAAPQIMEGMTTAEREEVIAAIVYEALTEVSDIPSRIRSIDAAKVEIAEND